MRSPKMDDYSPEVGQRPGFLRVAAGEDRWRDEPNDELGALYARPVVLVDDMAFRRAGNSVAPRFV